MLGGADCLLPAGFALARFEKALDQQLSPEFPELERNCFAELYSMAPIDSAEFHAMFRSRCVVLDLRYKRQLVGMAFVEEAGPTVGYLRVVCVHSGYRGRGLGTVLMQAVAQTMAVEGWTYLAFTAEQSGVATLAGRAGLKLVEAAVDDDTLSHIGSYNSRLKEKYPGEVLKAYHLRPDGQPVDAIYYLMGRQSG